MAHSNGDRKDTVAEYLRKNWLWMILVAGILALAAVLRFWDLGRQSMWFDELFSAHTSAYGPIIAIKSTAQDTNPPLYYVLQSLVSMWLGQSDWAMRVLPAVLGVLTTGVMYLAGRKLFNRETGLWAAGLFAVSAVALQYAQEARMYSLLMLLAALVLWLLGLLIERPTLTRAALLGVVLGLMAYTHVYGYMAMPMLLVPVVAVPSLRRRIGPHMAITYMIAVLLFLPWVFVIPTQVHSVQSQAATGGWWMKASANFGTAFAGNLSDFSPGTDPLPAAIFIALMIAGFAVRPTPAEQPLEPPSRKTAFSEPQTGVSESDKMWVLLTLALLPILVGLLITQFVTPIATTRNSLVCLPAAYLLAVRGGLKLWRPVGVTALAALLLFGVLQLPSFYSATDKGAWHQAVETVIDKPRTGVMTEDWETAFNVEVYTKVMGRDGAANVLWVNNMDSKPSPEGRGYLDSTVQGVPTFVWKWDRVYVVTQGKDSPLVDYMNKLPGWQLSDTQDLGLPVVRLYTRTQ